MHENYLQVASETQMKPKHLHWLGLVDLYGLVLQVYHNTNSQLVERSLS